RIWPRNRARPVELWTQRLLQLQLSILYMVTLAMKLSSTMWPSGKAAAYALVLSRFQFWFPQVADLVARVDVLSWVLTWGILMLEFLLGLVPFFPKRIRYPVIAVGCVFHLMIDGILDTRTLSYVIVAYLILSVDSADLRRWAGRAAYG